MTTRAPDYDDQMTMADLEVAYGRWEEAQKLFLKDPSDTNHSTLAEAYKIFWRLGHNSDDDEPIVGWRLWCDARDAR